MKIGVIDTDHYFYIYSLIHFFGNGENEIVIYASPKIYNRCKEDLKDRTDITYFVREENETWPEFLNKNIDSINSSGFDYFFIMPIYHYYKEHYHFISRLTTFNILVVFNLNGWINPPLISQNIRWFWNTWYKRRIMNKIDWIAIDEHYHDHAIKLGCKKHILHIPSSLFNPEYVKDRKPVQLPLKIIVPGTIAEDRRDYDVVLNAIKEVLKQRQDIEVVLLGDPIAEYGYQIHAKAKQINKEYEKPIIKLYDKNYNEAIFLKEILSGHFLIAPVLPEFYLDGIKEIYGISKSTGSCFDILAFAIPGVFPKWLSINSRFDSSTLRYQNSEQLSQIILGFLNHPDQLDQLRNKAIINSSHYSVEKVRSRLFQGLKIASANYQMCSRCVMDTNDDPNIVFDGLGHCNYCCEYFEDKRESGKTSEELNIEIESIINRIKADRSTNKYDCIVGVSGGADSMYVVHLLVKYGLRPLVVHYDNGWNSQLAVKNIEVVVNKLGLDLSTYVNDWEEFKDIQLSFMKASVIDIELVTDQAIIASLYKESRKRKIKYIFTGHNTSTESILPKHWYHWKLDGLNIKSIQKKFGSHKISSYPIISYFDQYYFSKTKQVQQFSLLNYVEYNKSKAKEILMNEYGWTNYSGKHTESIFTRFFQNYILPLKFNVDKRKAHLSSLICSGQITREQALLELANKPWETKETLEDKAYVIKKFEVSEAWFDKWMKEKPVSHFNYSSYLTRHEKFVQYFRKLLGRGGK